MKPPILLIIRQAECCDCSGDETTVRCLACNTKSDFAIHADQVALRVHYCPNCGAKVQAVINVLAKLEIRSMRRYRMPTGNLHLMLVKINEVSKSYLLRAGNAGSLYRYFRQMKHAKFTYSLVH